MKTPLRARLPGRPRRLLLIASVVFLGGSIAWLVLLSGPLGRNQAGLEAAAPAEAAARAELRSVTGSTCFERAIIDFAWGPRFAQVDQLAETNVWVGPVPPELVTPYLTPEGKAAYLAEYADRIATGAYEKSRFVGDFDVALVDIEGKLTARDEANAWVLVDGADGPVLVHWARVTTPKGRTIWYVAGQERAVPGGVCAD